MPAALGDGSLRDRLATASLSGQCWQLKPQSSEARLSCTFFKECSEQQWARVKVLIMFGWSCTLVSISKEHQADLFDLILLCAFFFGSVRVDPFSSEKSEGVVWEFPTRDVQ